jgi:hypothetical protein
MRVYGLLATGVEGVFFKKYFLRLGSSWIIEYNAIGCKPILFNQGGVYLTAPCIVAKS